MRHTLSLSLEVIRPALFKAAVASAIWVGAVLGVIHHTRRFRL